MFDSVKGFWQIEVYHGYIAGSILVKLMDYLVVHCIKCVYSVEAMLICCWVQMVNERREKQNLMRSLIVSVHLVRSRPKQC